MSPSSCRAGTSPPSTCRRSIPAMWGSTGGHQLEVRGGDDRPADLLAHPPTGTEHADPDHRLATLASGPGTDRGRGPPAGGGAPAATTPVATRAPRPTADRASPRSRHRGRPVGEGEVPRPGRHPHPLDQPDRHHGRPRDGPAAHRGGLHVPARQVGLAADHRRPACPAVTRSTSRPQIGRLDSWRTVAPAGPPATQTGRGARRCGGTGRTPASSRRSRHPVRPRASWQPPVEAGSGRRRPPAPPRCPRPPGPGPSTTKPGRAHRAVEAHRPAVAADRAAPRRPASAG